MKGFLLLLFCVILDVAVTGRPRESGDLSTVPGASVVSLSRNGSNADSALNEVMKSLQGPGLALENGSGVKGGKSRDNVDITYPRSRKLSQEQIDDLVKQIEDILNKTNTSSDTHIRVKRETTV